ncbi:peptidoglycan-binding protein [Rhabdobacter roseus]|uniref:Contractile injection system tube protein N-terminal domain-containing protein n=1 Tax=Rhabdobacter roseus TaxID=1655419 RepID=A0A840TDK3_9BACT|nr:LysM peptidoglycan-binding domain-containing protein [Rhabdobacter roseus]MBB5282186.1 hypothetical protein [Rhabdobacter roseus]
MENGKLEKMLIFAYRNPDLSDGSKVGEFRALMNPESYQLNYKIEYQDGQGQGTSSSQQKFKMTKPEEFSFEFLFDNTGIIDGQPKKDIWEDLKTFKQLLVDYDGEIHQPRHFKLVWGVTVFKGRLTELNITFKLFKPDGTPIRAVAKTTFKGSIEENLRVAKEDPKSPDLTHERIVGAGEHLSYLCFQIYEDPRYYLQVARANDLTNFRRIATGSRLLFPPLDKTNP